MGKAPCCDKEEMKKGPWTPEEDQKLIDCIQKHGPGRWRSLPKIAGLNRCGKSCRLRWTNYLRPDIKRGRFSLEEEETIIQLHAVLGNKWSTIAASLPGRTDNEIKNYWNTHIKKRLLKMGIDPVTHAPRLDLLELSSILSSSLYNSSRLNFTNLLGLSSLMDPNILNLAAPAILSAQLKPQENELWSNSQIIQTQFANTQVTQTPSCTTSNATSSAPALGVTLTQPPQPKMEQFCTPSSANFSSQSQGTVPLQNVWETYEELPSLAGSPLPGSNSGSYKNSDPTATNNASSENQAFLSNNYTKDDDNPNLSFGSLLSTPLCSLSTAHVSASNDDERDSFCSYFATDDGLDIGGIV